MSILGASSIYHTWDTSSENFVALGLEPGRMGVILVDGKDETISNSFISRFLVIGTSMRRLENLLIDLRTRSAQEGPTIHAFAHALSMVLSFLRDALTRCSLDYPTQSEPSLLSSMWMRYREYEEFLLEFAHLYSREIEKLPSEYPSIDSSPITLLSRIYDHLNLHLERRSPKLITAILGYVLTTTSYEYFQHVASAAGFNAQISHQEHPVLSGRVQESTDIWDEGEDAPKGYSNARNQVEIYPDFFPRELVDILPAAQKSLVLLRAAQPDHPLLVPPPSPRTIKWFWTLAEIEQAWSELPSQSTNKIISSSEPQAIQTGASQLYKAELEELQVFDLEPGLHLTQSQAFPGNTFNPIPKFIDTFPQLLPSIAPTLLHLTSLVFKPLLDHAALLSGTLLSLFLSDTGPLNFKGHLRLLRSYLLLTSPHFKSRLSEALFSGSDDPHDEGAPGKSSLKSLRRKPEKKPGPNTQPWAVGLSPALLERETWPPVGADLSFFLRTVIVDSLDSTKFVIEDGLNPDRKNVAEEAEYRLGFALRDLPTGSGKDNWLNPLAIEALDFLYMDINHLIQWMF
ncbi:Spc98 family-domain-containing protein [Infundibulicybe gibba]|nr:Spc98 family-domain-containing protein [Infundibulicybe gibba]